MFAEGAVCRHAVFGFCAPGGGLENASRELPTLGCPSLQILQGPRQQCADTPPSWPFTPDLGVPPVQEPSSPPGKLGPVATAPFQKTIKTEQVPKLSGEKPFARRREAENQELKARQPTPS